MSKEIPKLTDIYDTLLRVTSAIASVINVDITIVDKDLNRITGTGNYLDRIGKKVAKNCVFDYALKRKEKFIIDNPRFHEACANCLNKNKCTETAQVCCPINFDNDTIGIIGLIAFNKCQKSIIDANKENLLEFLSRMADLIEAKLKEKKKTDKINLMNQELEFLVDSIDIGVISTDENGEILRYNSIADEMFHLKNDKVSRGIRNHPTTNIENLIDNISIDYFSKTKCFHKNKDFNYIVNGKEFRGLYNVKPIIVNKKIIGYIFTFNKMNEVIRVVNDITNNKPTDFNDIIGHSKEITLVKEHAKRISKSCSTVLIQGESGTGKELFARSIHHDSNRKDGPFIPINCSAIPENLIESELFGYEGGAFTGANKRGRVGKFELANNGTIFLDEIGDMPLHMQTKLLRVLQENTINRVGGNKLIPINVRVLAATNKDLDKKVKEGEFREDLFYRLNVIPIYLPPLKDRTDDIEILVDNFINKFNFKLNRDIKSINNEVLGLFKNYNWQGNVRELENVVEYAVNMCRGETIEIWDLPNRFKDMDTDNTIEDILPISVLEKQEIIKAVNKHGNSKSGILKAAKALGISRATIYRKIKLYNIKY
ncbi:sigma-54 interaction domain-containing protein [Dethiothermospora halolimnae]|uniref:sigma-54 interaction domain-containing protein n=1 Tax=Dethiothermospora halolimnae TaxID=3114390 RepID=UPI003CCC2639